MKRIRARAQVITKLVERVQAKVSKAGQIATYKASTKENYLINRAAN